MKMSKLKKAKKSLKVLLSEKLLFFIYNCYLNRISDSNVLMTKSK